MPWIVRHEGDEWCVHKKNEDGSAGESVGCHSSEAEANDQMAALYANAKAIDREEALSTPAGGVGPPNWQFEPPKAADGSATLEMTKDGYDVKAEDEEDPTAKPPPNEGPEDPAPAEDKVGKPDKDEDEDEDKKNPFGKKSIVYGGALKALGDGRVGGLLVSFGHHGDRDLSGEYFDKATDLHMQDGYSAVGSPLLFHHGLDKKMGIKKIGLIETTEMTDAGVWAEGIIFQRDEYEKAIYKLAEQGKLSYSSGALPQGVRVSRGGHIDNWPIIEASLTPMPMQPFKTNIIPVKALPEADDLLAAAVQTETTPPRPDPAEPSGDKLMPLDMQSERMLDAALTAFTKFANITLSEEEGTTARENARKAIEDLGEATPDKLAEHIKSDAFIDTVEKIVRGIARQDEVTEAVKARLAAKSTPQPQAAGFRPDTNALVMRSKYADLSAQDMAFLALARKGVAARQGSFWHEEGFMAEMIDKAQKSMMSGAIKPVDSTMKAVMSIKANELNNTGNTGFGAEWVADLWSSDLWTKERFEQSVVASRIRTVDLPSDPYTLPLEASDPTIYHVPETTDEVQLTLDSANSPIPDSKVGTANLTITTEKIGGRVGFSTEITEDSIIPFVAQLRSQLMRSLADQIDYTILNGDTTIGTLNVSWKGATSNGTQVFTAFNGIRKHALGRTADGTINVNGTITLTQLRQARFKFSAPLARNLRNLVMFCDVQTYGAMLNLDQLNIWYLNGQNATVNTGEVPNIDGIPLLATDMMSMGDATGYVSSIVANNTKGMLVYVPLNQWILGYRRRVTATVEFLSYYDSFQLTATARIGMINRDAGNAVNAVLMYNITTL